VQRKRRDELDHLARVPMFSTCSRDELRSIARNSTAIEAPPGRILVHEGSIGKDFFVVLDGEADVSCNGKVVARIGPGSFFGELSLLDPAPRDATVTAATQMQLLVLTQMEFSAVLVDAPRMTRKLLTGMARRLRELDHLRAAEVSRGEG
jgi:CRP-like cAMP-binding protein